MSIKSQNPLNPIIVEGLWTLGKTSIAQLYCSKYKYDFISEPWHTKESVLMPDSEVDNWYLTEHKKREGLLRQESAVFLDRSILSTFAFNFALGRSLPDEGYLTSLKELIQTERILIVYIKAEDELFSYKKEELQEYTEDIQNIILQKELRDRYEEWYTKVLPLKYGITPLVVRVFKDGLRQSTEEITKDIRSSLINNRVAQVNIVCFDDQSVENLKVLVLKRSEDKGGFWQTITGGIHPGEDLMEAAQREIYEEINLAPSEYEIDLTDMTYSFEGNDGYILDEYVFACKIKDFVNIKISEEHETMEWLKLEAAQKKVKYENNRLAIHAGYKKISSSMRTA